MIVTLAALAVLSSTDCASCHPRQAAALSSSRHARAAHWPIFTAPLAHAPKKFCLSCHRPEGQDTDGLSCLSCHRVLDDANAVRAAQLATPAALAAHRVVVDPLYARDSCARCHEFATPLPGHFDPVVFSKQLQQSTISELANQFPAAVCTACHDPHEARGGHDAALLRSAVKLDARRVNGEVLVRVTAKGVGHRFPTGDPFRRMQVVVCEDFACTVPLSQQTIARSFAKVGGVFAPVSDKTLRDGETRVLRFPAGRAWRAFYSYGDPRFDQRLPPSEVSIELGRGTFDEGNP